MGLGKWVPFFINHSFMLQHSTFSFNRAITMSRFKGLNKICDLGSAYTSVDLLHCNTFSFSCMMMVYPSYHVNFQFGPLDCVRFIGKFC